MNTLNNRLTRTQLQAMLKLWDDGPQTARQVGVSPGVLLSLVRLGWVGSRQKRPLTYVGKTFTLYSLTDEGKREVLLTGKRFVVV